MHFGHNPFLVIISSPSGAGKSTICRMIVQNDQRTRLSVSATTRKQRPKEIDGKDYYFIEKKDFDDLIKNDQFLESAEIFGNHYGTPKESVQNQLNNGNDVLFDIDWQGARQILQKFTKGDVLTIFILPPSINILQERLRSRAQDHEDVVQKRMKEARNEISHYNEYDFIVVNENIDETYQKIKSIINCYRIKRSKIEDVRSFVNNLLET